MEGSWRTPEDTSNVILPEELLDLGEEIAENVHKVWADGRIREGWSYGPERSDAKKETPTLVPYASLPEFEKDYDRRTAFETLRFILKRGWTLVPPEKDKGGQAHA